MAAPRQAFENLFADKPVPAEMLPREQEEMEKRDPGAADEIPSQAEPASAEETSASPSTEVPSEETEVTPAMEAQQAQSPQEDNTKGEPLP
jgi:hypothetical protein